jgi:hypothetical protein
MGTYKEAKGSRSVEDRETAAYWYATGKGLSHDEAWAFCKYHGAAARAYYVAETAHRLVNVLDAFGDWQATL